jgi:tetratricopeptide (TPR) repeat protein
LTSRSTTIPRRSGAIRLRLIITTSAEARNNAYDRAIADFNEAIRLQPKADYFMSRGNAYSLKGDPTRAIADYDEALKLEPERAMAFNNRGVAWRDKGDRKKALADFKAAVALDPTLVVAKEHARQIEQIAAGAHPAKGAPLHALSDPTAYGPSEWAAWEPGACGSRLARARCQAHLC